MFVGAASQVNDLVTLDTASARKHRKRTNTGHVINFKSQNLTILLGSNASFNAVLSRVDVTYKRFQAVRDKLHGALEQYGSSHCGEVIWIGVNLDAKRAAHVFTNHPYGRLRQLKLP